MPHTDPVTKSGRLYLRRASRVGALPPAAPEPLQTSVSAALTATWRQGIILLLEAVLRIGPPLDAPLPSTTRGQQRPQPWL